VCHDMQEKFRIGHVTVQVEAGDPANACRLAPAEIV
ncbi:MAG: cation transporter, partial [Proteobacteria bacterium]|nr:cation transporter [Pseudomonadota bacterium]